MTSVRGGGARKRILELISGPPIVGTGDNDTLNGTEDGELIQGLGGHDTIHGLGGDDELEGGDGSDMLYGDGGDDSLHGGDGNEDDLLDGGTGNDQLYGGGGDDVIEDDSGNDQIYGEAGKDSISVNRQPAEAASTILIDGGDDLDVITYFGAGFVDDVTIFGGGGDDHISTFRGATIAIDAGEGDDRIGLNFLGADITITLGAGADIVSLPQLFEPIPGGGSITVTDFETGNSGDRVGLLLHLVSRLTGWDGYANPFATGHLELVQDGADAVLRIDVDGAATGSAFTDLVRFQNRTAAAFMPYNLGGFPADGAAPVPTDIMGTAGDDLIWGNFDPEHIQGLAGFDRIAGGAGDDLIEGGDDIDWLDGELGDDQLHGGNGDDQLFDEFGGDDQQYGEAGRDKLVVFRNQPSEPSDVLLDGGADNDVIQYFGNTAGSTATLVGGGGNDDIYARGGEDVVIDGGAGDDYVDINVARGPYSVTLGQGYDQLYVGGVVPSGAPPLFVTVTDFSSGPNHGPETDVLFLRDYLQTVLPSWNGTSNLFETGHLQLVKSGADALLRLDIDGFAGAGAARDLIRFLNLVPATLSAHNLNGFESGTFDLTGTSDPDVLTGSWGQNMITGLGSNDQLSGLAGDDILDGGAGTDTMTGGIGDDIYYVDDGGIPFGPPGDVVVEGANEGTFDRVRASVTYMLSAGSEVEILETVDPLATTAIQLTGNEFAQTINGNAGANILQGYNGDDLLNGGDGDDTLYGGNSSASSFPDDDDILNGGAGNDTLHGGSGNDNVNGGAGNDYLSEGGGGNNTLNGDEGNDYIGISGSLSMTETNTASGGAGNDEIRAFFSNGNLSGGDGNDIIWANRGTLALDGGDGDDQISFGEVTGFTDGVQTATGGTGADLFTVTRISTYNERDRILDFNAAEGDRLAIADVINGRTFTYWPITPAGLAFYGQLDPAKFVLGATLAPDDGASANLVRIWYTQTGGKTYLIADSDCDRILDSTDMVLEFAGTIAFDLASFAPGIIVARLGTAAADAMDGTANDDLLYGMAGDDVLTGGSAGLDMLFGGTGNDLLEALTSQHAYLDGGAGNDILRTNGFFRTVNGGDGDDLIDSPTASGQLSGGNGNDVIRGIGTLLGGEGNDLIEGGLGQNFLDGWIGDDVLRGNVGEDSFQGGSGIDTADYSSMAGAVTVSLSNNGFQNTGAGGVDRIGVDMENLTGSGFGDSLTGTTGANVLTGLAGDDLLFGLDGGDLLIGGLGADSMTGGVGTDTVSYADIAGGVSVNLNIGQGFGNHAQGDTYSGIENVVGSGLADFIIGSDSVNRLDGAGGDDILIGALGADALVGGNGSDTASYEDNWGAVFVNLTTGQGFGNAAQGDSYSGIENLKGGLFADFFIGDEAVNRLDGADGDDTLIGALGADVIAGGNGTDTASYEENWGGVFVNLTLGQGFGNAAQGDTYEGIENLKGGIFDDFFIGDAGANSLAGALGADTLVGAGGADSFLFDTALGGGNVDTINDFTAVDDTILLDDAVFAGLGLGALSAGAFVTGPFAGDADDRVVYNQITGALFFDADGNGAGAAVQFATLQGSPSLTAGDFMVI